MLAAGSRLFISSFLVLFGALWQSAATAQEQIPTAIEVEPSGQFKNTRAGILERMEERRTPSIVVGVAREGEILWLEAFGWADRDGRIPATPRTIYAVGSMSKSITATAALALVTQGRLTLTSPIESLIGDADEPRSLGGALRDARIHHLLDSTAGVPHGWVSVRYQAAQAVPMSFVSPLFIAFPPGRVFDYSNNSFGVLQTVVERITGQEFKDALQNLVFSPLGMVGSSARFDPDGSDNHAVPYDRSGSVIPRSHRMPEGGLGLYSTAHDLLQYGMFHLGAPLGGQEPPLSKALLRRMHTPASGPGQTHFHMGWWSNGAGVRVSNGSIGGANANLTLVPEENLVIVTLTNQTGSFADELSGDILSQIAPGLAEAGRQARKEYGRIFRTPYAARAVWLGSWRGKVLAPPGEVFCEVVLQEEGVTMRIGDGQPVPLDNVSLNEFDELRGTLSGRIRGLTPAGGDEHQIRLLLRLESGRLSGYVSAIFQTETGGFSLPAYIALERQGASEPSKTEQ